MWFGSQPLPQHPLGGILLRAWPKKLLKWALPLLTSLRVLYLFEITVELASSCARVKTGVHYDGFSVFSFTIHDGTRCISNLTRQSSGYYVPIYNYVHL